MVADTQQKKSSGSQPNKPILVKTKEGYFYELSGQEMICPVNVEQSGKRRRIHFHMKPYRIQAMKEALTGIAPSFSDEGPEAELQPQEGLVQQGFVKHYLLGLSNIAIDAKGTEASDAQKNQFLEANLQILEVAWREAVCGIRIIDPDAESQMGDFIVLGDGGSETEDIETAVALIDSEGEMVDLRFLHVLDKGTERDRRTYNKAQRTRLRTKDGVWKIAVNNDVIELLYNQKIQSLAGAVIEGEPCTSSNKDKWLPLVPLFWKIVVINEVYRQVKIKNV